MKTKSTPPKGWLKLLALLSALILIAAACGGADEVADIAAGAADDAVDGDDDGGDASAAGDINGDGILQVGIMGECEGPFGLSLIHI